MNQGAVCPALNLQVLVSSSVHFLKFSFSWTQSLAGQAFDLCQSSCLSFLSSEIIDV